MMICAPSAGIYGTAPGMTAYVRTILPDTGLDWKMRTVIFKPARVLRRLNNAAPWRALFLKPYGLILVLLAFPSCMAGHSGRNAR